MLKKRGLSAVITTLIVILLVLVSVGILWVVVRNLLQEGAEQISLGAFTLDLQIKKVEVTGDDVTVTVFVKRNPGKGNFVGINFVFFDGKDSEIIRENTVLKELEERSFTFTLTEISTNELETVSIAPIYELSSGRESAGDLSDIFDAKEGKSIVTGGVISFINEKGEKWIPPEGKQVFSISQKGDFPRFVRGVIDPGSVVVGDTQFMLAEVEDDVEVIEVTAFIETDNGIVETNLPLINTSSGNSDNTTKFLFEGSWVVKDTIVKTYRTTFVAEDIIGRKRNITLAWSDPCSGIPIGGSGTLEAACTLGTNVVDGIDNGDLNLGTSTLTLNAGSTFVWNSGRSITIGSGTIILNGGQLKKTNLWMTDADSDGYPSTTTQIAQDSAPTNGRRRYLMTSITSTDCNTADADVYRNVGGLANDADVDGHYIGSVGTQCVGDSFALNAAQAGDPSDFKIYYDDTSGTSSWIVANQAYSGSDCDNTLKYMGPTRTEYTDGDSDGYTVTVSSFCARYLTWGNSACSTGGSSYSKNSAGTCKRITGSAQTDCCDSDANAKPGQIFYYTTPRSGCGGYDYNCDSVETKEFPDLYSGSCDATCTDSGVDEGWDNIVAGCGQSDSWTTLSCNEEEVCEDVNGEECTPECVEDETFSTPTQSCR